MKKEKKAIVIFEEPKKDLGSRTARRLIDGRVSLIG